MWHSQLKKKEKKERTTIDQFVKFKVRENQIIILCDYPSSSKQHPLPKTDAQYCMYVCFCYFGSIEILQCESLLYV